MHVSRKEGGARSFMSVSKLKSSKRIHLFFTNAEEIKQWSGEGGCKCEEGNVWSRVTL